MAAVKADPHPLAAPGGKAPKAPDAPAPEAASAPVAATASSGRRGFSAWLPAIAAILLAPAATWTTVQFALLPYLQKQIVAKAAAVEAEAAAKAAAAAGPAGLKEPAGTYEGFQNVVVNLAGTMGTRYLKTSFLVTGSDASITAIFEKEKPRMMDVTISVLSSLSLAELEEPGAKNVIREKLVSAYNQALGKKVADQVYFSDFVIQ